MKTKLSLLVFILCHLFITQAIRTEELNETLKNILPEDLTEELPTVVIAILVRNKEHVLPQFLTHLEQLDYSKDRIALWIRSDHNNDRSIELLELWLNHTRSLYHSVNAEFDKASVSYKDEKNQFDWPLERYEHLITLKEQAFAYGKRIWADYIFFLDADVLLTSPHTLKYLTSLKLPVVAPMLQSESFYSNFWCGMTDSYYYERTDEYRDIYHLHKEGTFQVRMIHSAVLINLRHMAARYLTFSRHHLVNYQENSLEWLAKSFSGQQCRKYDGPQDDIIVFAISANCSQIPLFINNEMSFGYILQPVDNSENVEYDKQQLINIRTNMLYDLGGLPVLADYWLPYIQNPEKDTLGMDQIFMINLKRRPERRAKMEMLFRELGLLVEYFPAVDGKELTPEVLSELGIKTLPGYEDPYHHRQMTMGEIGCFLSHYRIWERMVRMQLEKVLILEDDLRFEPNFRQRALEVMRQAANASDFDLIYFGRKRLKDEFEPLVKNTTNLVHVGYSYWTLGYVITLAGAKKLIAAEPLTKLLPVDEFLPIMFNRHPNETWSSAFPTRNLIAYSASPLLLFPTHYTGDFGYISDTEDSDLTPKQSTPSKGAQLKSDREKALTDFDVTPEFSKFNDEIHLPDPNINEFANFEVTKVHEEL